VDTAEEWNRRDELAALRTRNAELIAALEQWKCGACDSGSVLARDGKWGEVYKRPCSRCEGSGLNVVAKEALKTDGKEKT
jgi:hypothetical protein